MPRIIAGEFRSRTLLSPPEEDGIRPYLDRVKESVFNALGDWFEGTNVVDLFAGTGTIGLEAVSRGAKAVLLVENSHKVFTLLEQNIATFKCSDRALALHADALGSLWIHQAPTPIDLLFVDPPYDMMRRDESRSRVVTTIGQVRSALNPDGFVILRAPIGPDEFDARIMGFAGPEAKQYAPQMWVLMYQPIDVKGRQEAQDSTALLDG